MTMTQAGPIALVALLAGTLGATAKAAEPPVDFVRDVRPILQQHCYSCHGEKSQKSGLRLDIKAAAFEGGDFYGPVVIAGNSEDSPLIQFVADEEADLQMPPDGDGLSAAEVATLTKWVREGAVWPDGIDLAELEDKGDHWSFEPLIDATVSARADDAWPRNAVDSFVSERLHKEGLEPAPEVDRVTWLRRVSFDLTGLPPSPEQVAAFLRDKHPDAYERVVARLLNSPRYGERWAQHWLDVVRYADTHGFEVNTERPNAWPYRDYVIDALNNDTPYDQFIREQIVGDALGEDAATGFLVTASVLLPGQIGKDEPSKRLARQDSLDEIVTNIGQTFLGLTVGCARCHDHKFDAISQRDYYEMQAFVAGVEYADRKLPTPNSEARQAKAEQLRAEIALIDEQLAGLVPLAMPGTAPSDAKRPPVNARMNIDRFPPVTAKRVRFTINATNNLEPCIDELEVFAASEAESRNVALATAGTTATSSGDTVAPDRHELRHINDGQYGNSRSWMSNEPGKGWVALEFAEEQTIERVVWGRDRQGKFTDRLAIDYRIEVADASGVWRTVADATDRADPKPDNNQTDTFPTDGLNEKEKKIAGDLLAKKKQLELQLGEVTREQLVFAGAFRTPDAIHLLTRGNPEQPKEPVAPAVLDALGTLELPKTAEEQQRRMTLAQWIASPENPLTARVMVNRIWQGHFGTGLVPTASDFGRSGTPPSHPELLDWLATEFIRSGWSIKHMHQLIVLSATYRQSTRHDPVAAAKDADDRLLWRFPGRRLEAEAIRDSMLAVSGRLQLKMGGRGFNLFDQRGGLSGFQPVESFNGEGLRRMIYAHKVRRERDAVFGAFDCPDNGQSTSRRRESTTPIQALNLFNSRFTLEEAEAFAARIRTDAGDDVAHQIDRAYWLAFSRAPCDEEMADAEPIVKEYGLATLCRVLLNSNEFLFLP